MARLIAAAALLAAVSAGWPDGAALAEEPPADSDSLQLGAEGDALDSAALGEVSGGTLLGSPVEGDAWRESESYPMEFPASVSAAGNPVSGAAITAADLGHRPPAGDEIGGAAGIAGDVAGTLW